MIFAVITGGLPNRITAVTVARITFVPAGAFTEPGLIQYLAVNARVMTESEAFAVALGRVDRLSDISAEHDGEAVRAKSAIIVDIGAMPGADRRLSTLVADLPRFRSKEIVTGRVALKSTASAVGRLPGVVSRAELINQFNARAVPIASEDVTDPARLKGKLIPSFRHYAPEDGDLSRDEVQARLSAAERLDVQQAHSGERGADRAERRRDRRRRHHADDDRRRSLRAVGRRAQRPHPVLPGAKPLVKVGGLDLAKARDHSALVTLAVGRDHLVIERALRLPHRPYREQIAALTPLLCDLRCVAYDAGGVGSAVGELLPAHAVPVLITAGDSVTQHGPCWHVGKTRLVRDLLHLAQAGRLVVDPDCPGADDLRRELEAFRASPTRRGVKLEARRGHDDLVMALALATFVARLKL